MPKFPELSASIGETLDLPVPLQTGQVKTYQVPPADGASFLWMVDTFTDLKITTRDAADDVEVLDDVAEDILYQRALGPVYAEMLADRAAWEAIKAAGLTALAWHLHGPEVALAVWTRGGFPKPSTSTTSEATEETPAAAPSTRSRASATGTTRKKTTASRGRTSSTGGASSKRTSTRSTGSTSDSPAS